MRSDPLRTARCQESVFENSAVETFKSCLFRITSTRKVTDSWNRATVQELAQRAAGRSDPPSTSVSRLSATNIFSDRKKKDKLLIIVIIPFHAAVFCFKLVVPRTSYKQPRTETSRDTANYRFYRKDIVFTSLLIWLGRVHAAHAARTLTNTSTPALCESESIVCFRRVARKHCYNSGAIAH